MMISGPACLAVDGPFTAARWAGCSQADYDRWYDGVKAWRDEQRDRIAFDDRHYREAALAWTRSAFIQTQAMMEDRYLYDPIARRWTVDRFLDDLKDRYGGIDAVLLWPSYPNIGVDDRNQLDMLLSMPGGAAGIKAMVADFHRRGVRVLFPYMLWDRGVRELGTLPDNVVKLLQDLGADGVNGDTQAGVPPGWPMAAERLGKPLAFQPELPFADEALSWNVMSWGQYSYDFVPKIDRYRWLERRHMVNVSDRWARAKSDNLQFAFFNGSGWESWENVWGIWNGITPRDGEATRRMATIQRATAPFLTQGEWRPFYPMLQFGIFASQWEHDGQVLWTVINRNDYESAGAQMVVPAKPGMRFYDLYHGVELSGVLGGNHVTLSFPMEGKGFGAILASETAIDPGILRLMSTMQAMTRKPLSSFDADWRPLPQTQMPIAPTRAYAEAPRDMIEIPAARFDFAVRGVEIEGSNDVGVDIAYPWEKTPRRFHRKTIDIKRFYIDRTLVTNAQFKAFLDATGYKPADPVNFLKHWTNGSFPEKLGNRPVIWVSLEDARAYASWAGKRLPHEWEWQYAAQGVDGRLFPWGNEWDPARAPEPVDGRALTSPAPVDAHAGGASPFGVFGMVGNVWQLTDEYSDEHSRAAIIRGGSYYTPRGSIWYFPNAPRLDQHGKLLLIAPSRDRSGTIGFRCVADAT
ncbi:formylglycine-generating enzyme family protein [Sphingobium aquiterrae]|uniref:formylglycine-generating enzyme family protein n=1 Tax=Sphingobium aquiterrae TaxID=2038656 RepID=UPI003015EF1A